MEEQTSTRLRIVDLIVLALIAACVVLLTVEAGANVQAELTRLGWGF
jgi:hypothetical protein